MTQPRKHTRRRVKTEFLRTIRYKGRNQVGIMAELMAVIAEQGGNIGDVKTLRLGEFHTWRDITIIANEKEHFNKILRAIKTLKSITIEQVIDEVLQRHEGGKIRMGLNHPIETANDMRAVYTPGVAEVCRLIKRNPQEAYHYTWIGRTVALMTNGSRTLGLGNIGPLAAMPVMEGKAALFNKFTGYNMAPIPIYTTDPKVFIETAVQISAGFGAIHLEDISAPACFEIEEALVERLNIPVMHDDQHGTAVVALAAVISACRLVKPDLQKTRIGQIGLVAAVSAIARLIMAYTKRRVLCCDSNPLAVTRAETFGGKGMPIERVMQTSDLVITTTGIEGLIAPTMIRKGQIILALTNPVPEITEDDAMNAGAAFYSDGRRVNNLLAYPGIFKGALDARATRINDEMLFAVADALVRGTPEGEIVPDPLDLHIHAMVARAAAYAAMTSGVAQHTLDDDYFIDDHS